jgi:hypothetical protein
MELCRVLEDFLEYCCVVGCADKGCSTVLVSRLHREILFKAILPYFVNVYLDYREVLHQSTRGAVPPLRTRNTCGPAPSIFT